MSSTADPHEHTPPDAPRSRAGMFLLLSLALHAAVLLIMGAWLDAAPSIELDLPDTVELGIEGDEGASGEPPPAAPPAPEPDQAKPPPEKPIEKAEPEPVLAPSDSARVIIDAGAPLETASAKLADAPDGGAPTARASGSGTDGAEASALDGDGLAPLGQGGGLGFGSGGFGTGLGGPRGAVIGLHIDLDRIRNSSLILETTSLLELVPEWLQLLDGSGLDALHDFSRIFVASPTLKRSALVVSGRLRGGPAQITGAVNALASARGKSATFSQQGSMRVAPWLNRGPTERVVGVLAGADSQIVIAREADVSRVLTVAAALAARHAKDSRMEHAAGSGGPESLLAMYEGEAAALSIEGVAQYVKGDAAHVPLGVRLSLRHVDEFNAELRAYGYYGSSAAAEAALPYFEALRSEWSDHPQAQYLGLRAALVEAKIGREGRTATLQATLTMHQVRYLLAFVSRALRPRE